jgi:mannitol-specific phosphotransferase system IIBC component
MFDQHHALRELFHTLVGGIHELFFCLLSLKPTSVFPPHGYQRATRTPFHWLYVGHDGTDRAQSIPETCTSQNIRLWFHTGTDPPVNPADAVTH